MMKEILFLLFCCINVANSDLIDRGNGLIYDNVLDITWLQNANLTSTAMNWSDSVDWAENLNFGGFDDWRLPTINVSTQDGSCDSSTTGGIRAKTGWNRLNTSFIDAITNDTVNFINLNRAVYWSGNVYTPNTVSSWFFFTYNGYQGGINNSYNYYAWAVRDGDIAAVNTTVPEPSTLVIFGLGLLALIRRKWQE